MKPLAFILLLLHMNFSMFIAQVDESDTFDAQGEQVHDINSLTDWLQASFSKQQPSKKHHDSDDDNARYFHALKPHHFFAQPFTVLKKEPIAPLVTFVPLTNDSSLSAGFCNIQIQPPKA